MPYIFGINILYGRVMHGNNVSVRVLEKNGYEFAKEEFMRNPIENRNMFFDRAIQYTQLTMEDPKNAHVLSELLISKEVLEDYRGEHNFSCTGEQISRYYQAYQYLL